MNICKKYYWNSYILGQNNEHVSIKYITAFQSDFLTASTLFSMSATVQFSWNQNRN